MDRCTISFLGNDSIVFLGASARKFSIAISIFNGSVFYSGRNNCTTNPVTVILSEGKHVFLGDDNLFASRITIRNADPHLIYDTITMERINESESVFIGDHVWIGQDVLLLKGTKIHSRSIIGASSVVTKKNIPSNTIWAGNPVRQVKSGIFWDFPSVHAWKEFDTERYKKFSDNRYVFFNDESEYLPFANIEKNLLTCKGASEKFDYLWNLSEGKTKNRFAVCAEDD